MGLSLDSSQGIDVVNVDVNGTDTEITYVRPVRNFVLKSRQGNTLYYRASSGSTKYFTLLPGEKIDGKVLFADSNWKTASLGFIRTDAGGSDTVEVLVSYW